MEESLKTMLHCDDKEKLKERLAILQREYNRTVQRLKRAERSEAVRNHVRSRLAEQNLRQEGHDPGGPSDPCEAKGRQCSLNQSVPEDQNRSPSVRFSLPHDVFGPCASPGVTAGSSASSQLSDTPQARSPGRHGESPAPAQGEQRRSVHRLRSRRSRLRWERRERADSGVSDTENSEDGRDPAGDGERVRSGSTQIHFGTSSSEAVCSGIAVGGADTEHAQHQGSQTVPASAHRAEYGDGRVACDAPLSDIRTAPVLEPPESSGTAATPSPSLLDTVGTPPRPVSEAFMLEPEVPAEESPQSSVARPTLGPDTPEAGGLGSCTLIEGLLFPVEYYVRTTRRMAAAQSSVDLGAVIQSQLSGGRAGRGRGRGRGRGKGRGGRGRASSAASRSPAPSSRTAACKDPDSVGHVTPESESSLTPWSSPAASGTEPPRPVRGGRRRGRRSGRGQGRRRDHAPPVASPLGIDPPTPEYLRTDAVLTPDTDARCRPAEKEMYPIFCTKSQQMESSSPKISPFPFNKESSQSSGKERLRGGVKCETLLLRSSPAPQRPHVFTPGGSHPSLRFLLSHFDAEDFHLPDDQFGTLKRLKLLSAAGDLESFVPHRYPYATRQRALGTPYGGAYRRRPRAARGLPPTDGPLSAQPDGKPAGRASRTSDQTDLGSDRNAPESLTPSLTPREVTRKEGCDSLPLGRADEAERIAGRCAAQEEGLGAGQEEGSAVRGADVAAGPSSPCVPNLSLTPTVPQTQKSTALALPSWGSPAFPSLGVTPAVPLQSSPPTQDCTPPTPTMARSPHSQPTPQCTALPTPFQGPVISCGLSAHTPSLSYTPSAGGHTQSHNAPCAAQDEAELREAEALTDGDQSAARAPSPDASGFLVTDSLSCGRSTFPLSCNPALSPAVEHGCNSSSPCPPDPGAPSPKPPESPCVPPLPPPLEGEGAVIDGADVSSSAEATPSTCLTDRWGEAVQQSQTAALGLSLPGAGRRGCADAGADADADMGSMPMADMGEKDFTQGADPHKPAQDSLNAAQLSGCSAPRGPDTLPSSSLRSEQGDKDLDCYFTDSAWSRGVQTPPQSGHSAWGQSPAEKRLDTPPQSPLTVQDGPLSSSLKLTHTLKAPADRCLVDVCSVYGAAGWCVVTAEEWKVCVWRQSSSQQWGLLHTWTFTEHPVISLLSVPDSHSLLCVSLGKLEIREARILCCAVGQLSQSVLCTGEVQAVLGVSGARVACCATSASTQRVQVFTLTEDGRLEDTLSLVSPGQSVQALAAVDGQKDALIGSTDSSYLVLWNMRTGHLLQRFALGESLSGTVCLRGYSQSGVLFLLLQHQFLHHINLDEGAPFSLIATNPVTAKSVLVHQLTQPSQCVGRFTEGDVWESAVLGVFQSGSLAVWDLRDSDCVARLARGPEEGCHIARWGGPSTLLTGHLSGEVFLYQYTPLGLS